MPVTLDAKDIALRLALTVLAGLVIGFNRSEHGRPAGIRTTLLVCLAASLSMILANWLLNTRGKTPDSFVVLDLMRLPLGVLSGMGFIGAGTILRKGNMVLGVTTAATLWFVTMMGMCFGAGALWLGLVTLALGLATLWGLKYIEGFIKEDRRGILTVGCIGPEINEDAIRTQVQSAGCTVLTWALRYEKSSDRREITCELQWRSRREEKKMPSFIESLRAHRAVHTIAWQPQGLGEESKSESRAN